MHGSLSFTSELVGGIASGLSQINGSDLIDVLICPTSVHLAQAKQEIADSAIKLGAQNVSAQPQGAFTGEVALPMLAEIGCEYVLLGHSERRELFAESDQQVAEKFAACAASNSSIVPVLCIGETLAQRQQGETEATLAAQIDAVLETSGIQSFANAVIAYEPVWAIGTGETATPEQAQSAHSFIRAKLAALDEGIAQALPILYGGSMKPDNAKALLSQTDIDGGLIGGASLKADSFVAICQAAVEVAGNQ